MILEEAHELALLHMEEWDLIDDFDFGFENCKSTLGRCHYYKKKITLSKWYAELNEEREIEDTILHEIAHALAWTHDKFKGHGKIWKDWAIKVGATPKACSKANLAQPKNHYKYQQTCCGATYKRHRLRKNARYYCPKCKKSLFLSK
tara:strand:- start:881 stop:1321 length:441 start_codon:yes stop_codon:yes gene_type:complete